MRHFAVTILAVLLSGCMVGPNYHRPAVEVMASWRFEDKEKRVRGFPHDGKILGGTPDADVFEHQISESPAVKFRDLLAKK